MPPRAKAAQLHPRLFRLVAANEEAALRFQHDPAYEGEYFAFPNLVCLATRLLRARGIRNLPAGTMTVLIAVTGWGQEKDRQLAFEAGFDHHMVKPVRFDAVTAINATVAGTLPAHPDNGRINLAQYCKLLNISRRRATRILVNLIRVGVIRAHNTEKTEFYTLS